MSAERGLGRGLGALLGDAALHTQEGGSVFLPISQVEPSRTQPRKRFEEEGISDLADSIREHGILQPLTVRRLPSGYYQIIAGERRWRAAREVGLNEVPALIIEADDRKAMELALIENLQREDLNPLEEAGGYQSLMDEFGLTQEEVSQRVGKSRPAVTNALRLLALPDKVQYLLEEGKLTAGHARALLGLPKQETQVDLAQKIIRQRLSVRQTEQLVKRLQSGGTAAHGSSERPHEIYLAEIEKDFSSRFGRKVSIAPGKNKGKLLLEFYNDDDLETLLQLLTTALEGAGK